MVPFTWSRIGVVAAVGLIAVLAVVSSGTASATSCRAMVSVDESLQKADRSESPIEVGVFETQVVVSSPAVLFLKTATVHEARILTWGVAPESWLGLDKQGGGFLASYWVCDEPPGLGDHRFFVVCQHDSGQSLQPTTGPAEGQTVTELRESLDARFGSPVEHPISTVELWRGRVDAWWLHVAIPAVLLRAWIHLRQRQS